MIQHSSPESNAAPRSIVWASPSRRQFLQLSTTAAGVCWVGSIADAAPKTSKRPNIILLVTDDQRWDTLGCMGNRVIQTPNLDRLARYGVLGTNNFCTTSICAPSRATLLTGMYVSSHGVEDFNTPLPTDRFAESYPVLLRQAGYRTGFVGKWGLGGDPPAEAFDYFTGFSGQGTYFEEIDGTVMHRTQILGDQALEFLDTCTPERPFCLSISFKAPHVQDEHPDQFLYDARFRHLYREDRIEPAKTAEPEYFQRLPDFLRESEGRVRWGKRFETPEHYQTSVKRYYRLITGVDDAVGRIVEHLERSSLADDTVILMTSDNGFFLGEHGLAGKWLMYEESIRTPLLYYDPRLPKKQRGCRTNAITLNIDVAPTLLALGGVTIPTACQGKNLLPLFYGETKTTRTEFFYEHRFSHPRIPKSEGIRTERWKYLRYYEQDPVVEELYDLQNDPWETSNLSGTKELEDLISELRIKTDRWKQQVSTWRNPPPTTWQDPR